jgi:hypothetical protein
VISTFEESTLIPMDSKPCTIESLEAFLGRFATTRVFDSCQGGSKALDFRLLWVKSVALDVPLGQKYPIRGRNVARSGRSPSEQLLELRKDQVQVCGSNLGEHTNQKNCGGTKFFQLGIVPIE